MSEPLTQEQRKLLDAVPAALESGVELLDWWLEVDPTRNYRETYRETFVANRPDDQSYGFFDTAPMSTGPLRINGNVQEMFYDEAKSPPGRQAPAAEWINEQVREFILRYFMRISDYREPEAYPEDHRPPPLGLGLFSQCPKSDPERIGFGFLQEYYKSAKTGEIKKFNPSDRARIVNLKRLGEDFEWIVLRNPIFDFSFQLKPFGNSGPQLVLPIQQFNYLVLSPDFIVDEPHPEPGILGRYGFGYAFVNNPEPDALAYGPGDLQPAFERLVWEVHESGKVTVRAAFVAWEPDKMLNLSIDPLVWGFQLLNLFGTKEIRHTLAPFKRFYNSLPTSKWRFDPVFPAVNLLNLLTFQQADKRLCISAAQLRKEFLFIHFKQHYQTIVGSLQTWRQIPDWLDHRALPSFVVTGVSS